MPQPSITRVPLEVPGYISNPPGNKPVPGTTYFFVWPSDSYFSLNFPWPISKISGLGSGILAFRSNMTRPTNSFCPIKDPPDGKYTAVRMVRTDLTCTNF